jgi:hypothetical protein
MRICFLLGISNGSSTFLLSTFFFPFCMRRLELFGGARFE